MDSSGTSPSRSSHFHQSHRQQHSPSQRAPLPYSGQRPPSPLARPANSHFDYLPRRSAPSPHNNLQHHHQLDSGHSASDLRGTSGAAALGDATFAPSRSLPPFGNIASASYVHGNNALSEQRSMSHAPESTRHSATTPPEPAVTPRKRNQVEDILNPVHEETVVVSKQRPQPHPQRPQQPEQTSSSVAQVRRVSDPSSTTSTPQPPAQTQPPTTTTPVPKPLIPPSSGSAITISSSTVSSSKSTPTSTPRPAHPIKQPKSIRLHVPLNGSSNVYINFASLAEKTYGPEIFNSKRLLGPQGFASSFLNHDRLLGTDSEAEAEADEDGGDEEDEPMEDVTEEEGPDGTKKRKKKPAATTRRKRQTALDKYDVDDPFIDDSEALMDQVAAASKDGFFVYSGPLIAEGERPKIDKADAPKKRKAPVRKSAGEKVPRAKKVKDKDKDKGKASESGVEDTPPVAIAQ